MDNGIYVATESGSTELDGEHYVFTAGETRVREGHPLLKHCGHYFAPVDETLTYDLETAVKSPRGGQRRGPKAARSEGAETKGDE